MREMVKLIGLAQTGDKQAEEELLRRYERLVHKYAWHNGQTQFADFMLDW
jgi:DNA-directed RNA polymerase specialized sigma subunit